MARLLGRKLTLEASLGDYSEALSGLRWPRFPSFSGNPVRATTQDQDQDQDLEILSLLEEDPPPIGENHAVSLWVACTYSVDVSPFYFSPKHAVAVETEEG